MSTPAGVRVRVGDALVARLAAQCALGMPGVALHADLGQALLGVADSLLRPDLLGPDLLGPDLLGPDLLGPDALRRPPAGARATVQDGSVEVALTIATSVGHNCRDLARAVQQQVAAQVQAYTGLETVVMVTIAEIHLD